MPEIRGQLLPVYVVADESGSMETCIGELNAGLTSLHQALLAEPMAAAKIRFSVLGFSDDVIVRVRLVDLRDVSELPELVSRGRTSYGAAFSSLLQLIPDDVSTLKRDQYLVHRPAVVFLSDGLPTDGERWRKPHRRLTDRNVTWAAPNIIACGVGQADPQTILDVATNQNFAFVAIAGSSVGSAVAEFCTQLMHSVVESGRALAAGTPELSFDKPAGFAMAIDEV